VFGLDSLGRMLVFLGVLIALTGGLLLLISRIPALGRLPGDIHLTGRNWSCWIPLGTCIALSLVLTVLLNLIARLLQK